VLSKLIMRAPEEVDAYAIRRRSASQKQSEVIVVQVDHVSQSGDRNHRERSRTSHWGFEDRELRTCGRSAEVTAKEALVAIKGRGSDKTARSEGVARRAAQRVPPLGWTRVKGGPTQLQKSRLFFGSTWRPFEAQYWIA